MPKPIFVFGQHIDGGSDINSKNASNDVVTVTPSWHIRFSTLLHEASSISPELRIRWTSPHPKDFPDDLLYVIREHPNICKNIHLPCQSGSTIVLERMRRGYTKEAYLELVDHIRSIIPDISISSDFISGFCSETDEDHQHTLELIRKVKYNYIYSFLYSIREKTKAYYHLKDDIPREIKAQRHHDINEIFRSDALKLNSNYIGQTHLVLVEGISKRSQDEYIGRNDYNTKVIFSKKTLKNIELNPGDYVAVRIDTATSESLRATPLYRTTLKKFYDISIST
ncbi:unnamed protein product [Didymodactylos carnosus]|uniref:Uncharacterized protein n=1 Tax=Didymodactylos carnosus TaxID=1234261 RepID=A0A814SJ92_9BILA|nr:unnamed protein product [Didymodactylos carnosus]CAF3912448.1 unnamed protein product [Didymodactylos carnosus]